MASLKGVKDGFKKLETNLPAVKSHDHRQRIESHLDSAKKLFEESEIAKKHK